MLFKGIVARVIDMEVGGALQEHAQRIILEVAGRRTADYTYPYTGVGCFSIGVPYACYPFKFFIEKYNVCDFS